jgi:hypothetical protein
MHVWRYTPSRLHPSLCRGTQLTLHLTLPVCPRGAYSRVTLLPSIIGFNQIYSPMLSYVGSHKDLRGNGGRAWLNFGIRWKWKVSFLLRSLYRSRICFRYPQDSFLAKPQNVSGDKNNSCTWRKSPGRSLGAGPPSIQRKPQADRSTAVLRLRMLRVIQIFMAYCLNKLWGQHFLSF